MSDLIRNDFSTESLCTVIENSTGRDNEIDVRRETETKTFENRNNEDNNTPNGTEELLKENYTLQILEHTFDNGDVLPNGSLSHTSAVESCDTANETSTFEPKLRTKTKKSVSFDPNDEKVRKFIDGEPIVDQKNPFKSQYLNGGRKKRIPPPVPAKRSTLSIKKTVTQQLREREREREKERERLKNEANNRKIHLNGGTPLNSPEDFVTTEEVLKQSKYVKTYIKNPDPYFVYDPTVLARIKFEELRETANKKPQKKSKNQPKNTAQKDGKQKPTAQPRTKLPTFKKCSKPNYPDLSDIRIKVGTKPDDNYFNPAEVTKNAKKFDERVKKLHIQSDVDLDEIEEPLTKSESSDEVTVNGVCKSQLETNEGIPELSDEEQSRVMNGYAIDGQQQPADGTFTGTIRSKEFQEYLDKKGLTLIPKKIPNGAQSLYTNGAPRNYAGASFRCAPEPSAQISLDTMDASRNNNKKPSVFQRLLANSIFAPRRKTTPKEPVPMPRSLYNEGGGARVKENGGTAIKRVVLERQSFHGRPRVSIEANDLRQQTERSRRSFNGGDDLSISISSALTNAEYSDGGGEAKTTSKCLLPRRSELQAKSASIAKPPRRTLSRDRLRQSEDAIIKPRVQRAQLSNNAVYTLPNKAPLAKGEDESPTEGGFRRTFQGQRAPLAKSEDESPSEGGFRRHRAPLTKLEAESPTDGGFRRTMERQSLIPKRTTQNSDKRQVFGRTSSMDRNEILRRTASSRGSRNRSDTIDECLRVPTNSKENLRVPLTSTPVRGSGLLYDSRIERNGFSPIAAQLVKPVYVDQQEWQRLRAIKEQTDRELYYKMLQQPQPRRHDPENIYERLQPQQQLFMAPQHATTQQLLAGGNFMRGSLQRNTFSGVIRNRQAKIIDGRAVMAEQQPQRMQFTQIMAPSAAPAPRSQSVLDNMTSQQAPRVVQRRGYESDTDTPVVLRRKQLPVEQPQRRIGGILTREEILQKVKEFCRKSMNKTPTPQPQVQAMIYEKQLDISPVSYASVDTQRPGSRLYAAPQVPQRMQSLPQQFVLAEPTTAATSSPIYAHVIKRSSLQSNHSELYDSPQQRPAYIVRRESELQPSVYMSRVEPAAYVPAPVQYVILDNEQMPPAQMYNYQQPTDFYAPPAAQQLQPYSYVTLREPAHHHHAQPQFQRPLRLHDGRSTPLILDRSSQQASQIYWTPQHQRLPEHTELLPVHISPRYTLRQSSQPVPAPRMTQQPQRATSSGHTGIPQQNQNRQQFMPIGRSNTPTKQVQQQQRHAVATKATPVEYSNMPHPYEWESGSEAGEVQRIMDEHQRNSDLKYSQQNE